MPSKQRRMVLPNVCLETMLVPRILAGLDLQFPKVARPHGSSRAAGLACHLCDIPQRCAVPLAGTCATAAPPIGTFVAVSVAALLVGTYAPTRIRTVHRRPHPQLSSTGTCHGKTLSTTQTHRPPSSSR